MFCYGELQALFYSKVNEMDIIFHEGIPLEINTFCSENHQILILDDPQHQAASCQTVECLFSRISHHQNFTMIYIVPNCLIYVHIISLRVVIILFYSKI